MNYVFYLLSSLRYFRSRGPAAPGRQGQALRAKNAGALFVGAKAYEQAGGTTIRDLFDADGGGFFADAELLNRLAREKLQADADKVTAEG